MRVLATENIKPINVLPGDGIQLTYREEHAHSGLKGVFKRPEVSERVLMTETFTEERTIDRIAIVELEGGELQALGMSQAIAGVFGRQA